MRAQDPVLSRQILVLEKQFLIDQAGHIRQQAHPFVFFHLEWP
jgi:hypothetical protein